MKTLFNTVLVASLCMSSSTFAAQIVGHRGASFDAPENTLSSFKLGYKQNADADELDIHLTKDGKVVVMHDYDMARTGGEKLKVSEHTLEELRALDIGKWGKWQGKGFSEKIPLLEEVLALIPDGKRLFIEIKCGPEVLPELANVLKKAGKKPEQTVIIGFGYETMQAAKEKFPNLEVNWLVQADKKKVFPPVEDLIAKSKAAKLDGLDLNQGFPIDKQFVDKVHAAGLKLYTWTVDDPIVAKAEAEAGVDGITTNRPGWMREQLAAKS
ncbi:glycerophosphodiester phosphodiesterase [Pedosphaera parvula]|uniref:Glycerophosphoryl diester phosphodiesterase n=1 Tax=Pedosphaera parvula (strain Ellin514) TaxID=320771 RepID=B9XKI9_PEDPL|nr:glycerophosphodiester phosphodiesterase [Pedosphaera parvula]EEF59659.1 glycerophosphoryl diester phosphodiesterase [Pedosphaera parvula Ellin514]